MSAPKNKRGVGLIAMRYLLELAAEDQDARVEIRERCKLPDTQESIDLVNLALDELLTSLRRATETEEPGPHDERIHGELAYSQTGIMDGCERCDWLKAQDTPL